jgi:hypothetical protein
MEATLAQKSLDYAAAVILRRRRGELKALVQKTVKVEGPETGRELWQFIGGMEETVDQGNPLRTLDEELREESGYHLRENYQDPVLIYQENQANGHTKRFYLVWREGLRGDLRKEPIRDGVEKILEPPIWKSIDFLKKNLCESHRGPLQHIISIDKKFKGL